MSPSNPMPNVSQEVDVGNKRYVFNYILNEDVFSLKQINHKDRKAKAIDYMKANPQTKIFVDKLLEEKFGIRFTIVGSNTHSKVSNDISYPELISIFGK